MNFSKILILSIAILLAPASQLFAQGDYSSFPEHMETLLGKSIDDTSFSSIKAFFGEPTKDDQGNLVLKDAIVKFIFRGNDKTLWQIQIDLLYYNGPVPLGLEQGMNGHKVKRLLSPDQTLRYNRGAYYIGSNYSVLASFLDWPRRHLDSFVLLQETPPNEE